MANSYKIYTYTTGDAIFSVPFDYINTDHLFVFLDGTPTSEFTFLDSQTIRLNTPPASGTIVGIYRLTPEDELLVKFKNTSDLNEDNLNTFQQQLFFLMQEKSDGLSTTLGQGTDGNWDAVGKTIKNLPTPVADGDPVRKVDIPALAVDGVGDLQTRMVTAEEDIDTLQVNVQQNTTNIATKADKSGSTTEVFNVANGTETNHAVNKGQLDTKADLNLSNISTVAKDFISSLSVPSARYIDITLGATGSTYTAPANGWLNLRKLSTAAGQYIELAGRLNDFKASHTTNISISAYIPVKKGDVIIYNYTAAGTTQVFRFIYSEGAE